MVRSNANTSSSPVKILARQPSLWSEREGGEGRRGEGGREGGREGNIL